MPRIRSIKPESCLSETLANVSTFACLTFAYLPCFVDDEGRMKYSPILIKAQLYPLRTDVTESMCESAIGELANAGVVDVYENGGKTFLQVTNFIEHQHPQKAKKSELPSIGDKDTKKITVPVMEQYSYDTGAVNQPEPHEPYTNLAGQTSELSDDSDTATVQVAEPYSKGMVSRVEKSRVTRKEKEKEKEKKSMSCFDDDPTEEAFWEFVSECIEAFNSETGSNVTVFPEKAILGLSRAYSAGRRIDDVRLVIRDRKREWGNDKRMKQFLFNPSTLFGKEHFESYLAAAEDAARREGEFDEYE